tara:strand:- start:1 stop:915 length:915 start_codon:yes stop_codon:yes gene_type:complete
MKKALFILLTAVSLCSCTVTKLPLNVTLAPNTADYVKPSEKKLFANFHGLQTSANTVMLEGEGMTFTIEKVDLPPTKKSLNKIKNAYMAGGDLYYLENTTFKQPSMMLLGGEVIVDQYSTTSLLFIVPAADSTMFAIIAESAFMLDFERAGVLVKDIVDNGLPNYIITDKSATVVDFAGRTLELGNVCKWDGPHNISCEGLGELYWSLYKTTDDALMARQINMAITEAQSNGVVEKDENARVTFEGTPMAATKVVYKGDNDNPITTYYLSTFLRGHYIFCKVSFTAEEAKGEKLSPLAARVISL